MLTCPEQRTIEAFRTAFGYSPALIARAPGRVNLIGEHTDYNDGFVLPVAIDRAVYVAAAPRHDDRVRAVSLDYGERAEFGLANVSPAPEQRWSNYVRAVAWALQDRGVTLRGADALVHGDVPIGAGLSSSAALEVATARALLAVAGEDLPPVELALTAQGAENDFVGMQCGVMDQFISVLGRRDHALLIDCRSLEHRLVPLPAGYSVVVANTMKQRGLVDSEYNRRRAECEEGVRVFAERLPGVRALRDVGRDQLEECRGLLRPTVYRRCRYVVEENERVLAAGQALVEGDLAACGRLMGESHAGLRDDYEVSCAELDHMVEAAADLPGLVGARMTGAGFGGCTVNLVQSDRVDAFAAELAKRYAQKTGVTPKIYVCRVEHGAEVKRLP